MKKENAITLISLIITIIILIILAGVAVNLSLGENGIFRRSILARNLYSNAQVAETRQINEIEQELENVDLDLPEIPYKGLGYKFIYDGTLGEPGAEGKNMCNEETGGWSTARTTFSIDGGMSYNYYYGWLFTNNKINLIDYTKLYVSSNMVDDHSSGLNNCIYLKVEEPTPDNGLIMQSNAVDLKKYLDVIYYDIGKNTEIIDISNNKNGYIGILSVHATVNTWYFDYKDSYMRNYTDPSRYIDLYSIIALKEDNWQTWVELANIDVTSEENNSLEKILNNNSTLQKIFQDKKANQYLLKCTGTLMVEILKNDNSYNNIPHTLLEKMKENDSWNHFLKVCERE